MSAVERLAHLIAVTHGCDDICTPARIEAQALVDAGWHDGPKVTDSDQAVLDAAEVETDAEDAFMVAADGPPEDEAARWLATVATARERRSAAVRARREAQP